MGTKKTTSTTNQYDPSSMGAFQSVTPAWAGQAKNFIQNPYGNPQFQFERQMGQQQANLMGQNNINQLMQNQTASGMGGGVQSPFMQEMLANQARANTGLSAQLGFINPTQMANQRQQYSMGLGQSYRPLQTGQQQTEKTGGLGTWLPQVAGMGLGLATGGMGGLFGSAISPLMHFGNPRPSGGFAGTNPFNFDIGNSPNPFGGGVPGGLSPQLNPWMLGGQQGGGYGNDFPG